MGNMQATSQEHVSTSNSFVKPKNGISEHRANKHSRIALCHISTMQLNPWHFKKRNGRVLNASKHLDPETGVSSVIYVGQDDTA